VGTLVGVSENSGAQVNRLAEATKVAVDSAGYITGIGKGLVYRDALDTGGFLLIKSFFQALDDVVPKPGIGIEISDIIRLLVSRGHRFATYSVSGHYRADVDTPEGVNMVRAQTAWFRPVHRHPDMGALALTLWEFSISPWLAYNSGIHSVVIDAGRRP